MLLVEEPSAPPAPPPALPTGIPVPFDPPLVDEWVPPVSALLSWSGGVTTGLPPQAPISTETIVAEAIRTQMGNRLLLPSRKFPVTGGGFTSDRGAMVMGVLFLPRLTRRRREVPRGQYEPYRQIRHYSRFTIVKKSPSTTKDFLL